MYFFFMSTCINQRMTGRRGSKGELIALSPDPNLIFLRLFHYEFYCYYLSYVLLYKSWIIIIHPTITIIITDYNTYGLEKTKLHQKQGTIIDYEWSFDTK